MLMFLGRTEDLGELESAGLKMTIIVGRRNERQRSKGRRSAIDRFSGL